MTTTHVNKGPWTEEERGILRQHYPDKGLEYCLTLLNRTNQAARAQLILLGIKRKRGIGVSGVTEEEIVRQYRQIKHMKTVAKMFGVCVQTISQILKRHGVERLSDLATDAIKDQLIADYQANQLKWPQIEAKYGLSRSYMFRALKSWGVVDPDKQRLFIGDINARRAGRTNHEMWTERYGKEEADKREAAANQARSKRASGAGNPMYGKPSPQGAGNGWKGWYRGHYFRSLREAAFMIRADNQEEAWQTGEKAEFVVKYLFNGAERTYRPDFVIGNVVYEIKPKRLHASLEVVAKRKAAEAHFGSKGMRYELIDIEVDSVALKAAYDRGEIRLDKRYEERFLSWVAD